MQCSLSGSRGLQWGQLSGHKRRMDPQKGCLSLDANVTLAVLLQIWLDQVESFWKMILEKGVAGQN